MIRVSAFSCLVIIAALAILIAGEPPRAEISNGLVKVKLLLPDGENSFYRGTRFEWSGTIEELEYKGHKFFGAWFTKQDSTVRDIQYDPETDGFAAGSCSSNMGPVEEFRGTLGYDEAKVGETFVKIGVGVLRKPQEERYNNYFKYDVADPGKWTIKRGPDQVEFTHELSDTSGYGYTYRKVVRLTKGKPELVLEHSLKNTGKKPITTSTYDHNFIVIDKQPTGPDFAVKFPYEIKGKDAPGIVEIHGKEIVWLRELQKDERASVQVEGFGDTAKDYDISLENRKVGAGVRITSDQPMARLMVWSIRPVRSPEATVNIKIEPGSEFTWRYNYEFYTIP